MATLKEKTEKSIDRAAAKAKRIIGKGIDRTKEGIRTVGEKVIRAGKKIRKRGS